MGYTESPQLERRQIVREYRNARHPFAVALQNWSA